MACIILDAHTPRILLTTSDPKGVVLYDPKPNSLLTFFSSEYPESIFSPAKSAWDHVFLDIKDMPPLRPSAVRRPLRRPPQEPGVPPGKVRRQAMTAREIGAFDEMFNMIFNAVSQREKGERGNSPLDEVGIGSISQKGRMGDIFGTLRRHSKRLKWTSESDELLDRKREEMEFCDSDQQLLDWAMREVFGESRRYEEVARKAIADAAVSGVEPAVMPILQPETYPHLVALLMRSFRDKYRDPHLALSIFNHARHLSIPSYVFGCTTPAYNELIETRWKCFRDLKGVHDALEEMAVNGVDPNNRTRQIVEALRREVGERNLWEEENDLDSGEVWKILNSIDSLAAKRTKSSNMQPLGTRQKLPPLDHWKRPSSDSDDWQFGKWGDERLERWEERNSSQGPRQDWN